MGKLSEALGKLGDKTFGTPEQRRERKELERQAHAEELKAYQSSYRKERLKQAKLKGKRRARAEAKKGSGLDRALNIMSGFQKAGEELAFNDPFATKKKKKKNEWLF